MSTSRSYFIWLPALTAFLLLASFVSPQAASAALPPRPAEPSQVILFPQSAQLSVQQTVQASDSFTLFLPQQADQDSLSLKVGGNTVTDINWQRVPVAAAPPATAAIEERLKKAEQALAEVRATEKSIEARIDLWSDPRSALNNVAEVERLNAAMEKRLTALYAERATLEPLIDKRKQEVKEIREELKNATGGAEHMWLVTASLAKPVNKAVPVEYTYTASGCGWAPAYTLHARPDKGTVLFTYAATLWQRLGMDWTNTRLAIATMPPRTGLTPPALPDWDIEQRVPRPEPRMKVAMMMADAAPEAAEMAAPTAPVREMASTYAIWQLGSVSLAAGKELRIPIVDETWKAEFVYTIRPARSPRAFLTARVTLPEARLLPPGVATMIVDNATAGTRRLEFAGTEETFHFGSDPLVTATMNLQKQQEGTKGFIGKKQVFDWAWDITIANARSAAVNVEVQDAAPRLRMKDMELELTSSPAPELDKEEHIYVWKLQIPAQSETAINHNVTVTAPADVQIDTGRRQ
ncbi:mucoidy inhibitor MuiA family protein [Oleidesulfovibrio sp.]|uniref:mucoidy inhibitor MuiA family protein n=1 Tax=Oleidesulfovibrio sp. TaxID=2909707 RepID=UPI003A87AE73